MFLSSEAQYQMMEDLKEKGEIKYFTKIFTGKAFRTARKLALAGYVKVKTGTEQTVSAGEPYAISPAACEERESKTAECLQIGSSKALHRHLK